MKTAFHRSAVVAVALAIAAWTGIAAATEPMRGEVDNPHGEYREDCSLCHGPDGWKPANVGTAFDHGASGFPLVGAHVATPCTGCHATLEFRAAPTACMDCHDDVHLGELGTACERCHDPRSFLDRPRMQREHGTFGFPLTGAHLGLDCMSCHPTQPQGRTVYLTTPSSCVDCHESDYDATNNPDHEAAGFGEDCRSCHSTLGWQPATFDHADTAFPLTGAHTLAPCSSCHAGGSYEGTTTECVGCHRADYDGSNDPDHADAGFPTSCETCHGTTTWIGANFDHAATDFPLTGAHKLEDCSSCHGDGVYTGKSSECVDCHRADYDGVTDPDHADAGFPTDCESCHGTATWEGATFDHGASDFPLTGAHRATSCESCHGDGVYDGRSGECRSCHQADYDSSRDPDHRAAGFPDDCESCHGTSTWEGARFDHDADYFPIYTGRHRAEWSRCSDCHTNANNYGVFDCLGCHPHSDRRDTDDEHRGESGYSYTSSACYRCHPRGTED